MKKVHCTGFQEGQKCTQDGICSIQDIVGYFPNDQDGNALWFKDTLEKVTYNQKNVKDGFLKDMFVALEDPLACADTICESIDREFDRLQSIIQASQTGIPPKEIFEAIVKEKKIELDPCNEQRRQIGFLHTLATTSYRYVFDNPELEKTHHAKRQDYYVVNDRRSDKVRINKTTPFYVKSGVSKEKLEKILAVKERRKQRNRIHSFRDDLGELMESDYYQDVFDDYLDNIGDYIEDGNYFAINL